MIRMVPSSIQQARSYSKDERSPTFSSQKIGMQRMASRVEERMYDTRVDVMINKQFRMISSISIRSPDVVMD